MQNKNFTLTLLTDQSPEEVFNTIKNVRGWWSGLHSEKFEGSTDQLNDEFTFRAGEGLHYSRQKLIELIPGKRIAWLVTDSTLTFLKNKNEWVGTKIIFEISRPDEFENNSKTQVVFTHEGLVPEIECYNSCSSVWTQYLQQKLLALISKGKQQPNMMQEEMS